MPPKIDAPEDRHVLSLLVDNEAGTLGRVAGLFSGRGYNIHSLTVAEVDPDKNVSRITITTYAPKHVIEHIITLLEKLVPVHKVKDLTTEGPYVERGLVLIKVKANSQKRDEILRVADTFGAEEVDSTSDSFVFELNDIPAKLNEFIDVIRPYGIIELSRTGITAISRGNKPF